MVFYTDRNYLFEDIQKEIKAVKEKYNKSSVSIVIHYLLRDGSIVIQTFTNEKLNLHTNKMFELCDIYFNFDLNGVVLTFSEV